MTASSYWETTTSDIPADIAIIGGGFTGLNMALECRRLHPQARIVVVERAANALGASTRNAGFACFGSPTELLADLEINGEEITIATVQARLKGIRRLEQDWSKADIGWEAAGGYEIITDEAIAGKVDARLPRLNALLQPITGISETWRPTSLPEYGPAGVRCFYNSLEAQLNPAALHRSMRERCRQLGIHLLNGTEITNIEATNGGFELSSDQGGQLRAGRVGVCTNAFIPRLLPDYGAPLIRPVRNQVLVSRRLPGLRLRGCWHFHEGYVYFRNIGTDRLLIGGGRHLAGAVSETDVFGDNAEVQSHLITWLAERLPQLNLRPDDFPYRWSGILAQGVGKGVVLEEALPGLVVAGRLAGMGVALSGELGRRAAALIR